MKLKYDMSRDNPLSLIKERMFAQPKPKQTQQPTGQAFQAGKASFVNMDAIKSLATMVAAPVYSALHMPKLDFSITQAYEPAVPFAFKQAVAAGHQLGWDAANFLTTTGITCLSIVAIQSPVKTVLTSVMKNGTFLPPVNGGIASVCQVLYRGTSKSITGSAMRTAYIEGAKEAKPQDDSSLKNAGYVLSISMGELAVTQVTESLSTLEKADIVPKKFDWKTRHNFTNLMKCGFTPRYMSAIVNLGSLCVLSQNIAQIMPTQDKKLASAMGGAASGMIAGVGSYPFAALKDYILVQTTVQNGKLATVNELNVVKEMLGMLKDNPKLAMKKFGETAAKQLPMRMALTAIIFSIVSGLSETLGSEPLKAVVPELEPKPSANRLGFFSNASESNMETPDQQNPDTQFSKLN